MVDVDRFDDVLRDPFPFCERISTWSGQSAMRMRLSRGLDMRIEARAEHYDPPLTGARRMSPRPPSLAYYDGPRPAARRRPAPAPAAPQRIVAPYG